VRDGSADVDAVLPGVLRGTSSLSKTNSGTLLLSANNEYSGGTNVMEGRLLVSNTTGSGTGTGAVTVSSGATLGGTGKIGGAITVNSGGIVAPGESIGMLTVDGAAIGGAALTLASGATLLDEVNNTLGR